MFTPLLDWTESPFVALYFAMEENSPIPQPDRAVWGLGYIRAKNTEIRNAPEGEVRTTLEIRRPMQDENTRLVSQSGLFTELPLGTTVEQWVRANFKGETTNAHLIKMTIPSAGRADCLRTLNRMNINHLSLFPDLYGAGKHCNDSLEIPKYTCNISS
jgi:hypothetical protein